MVKGAQADFELAAALFYVLGAQVPHQKELEPKARDMVQSLGRRKALEKSQSFAGGGTTRRPLSAGQGRRMAGPRLPGENDPGGAGLFKGAEMAGAAK